MVLEYLKKNYEPGEPIFVGDLVIDNISEENLRYHLKKLTDTGILSRFDSGVYYFPKIDIFGEPMSLSIDTVLRHKYILRKGKRVGYYSGYTLANYMGLSTQVPFIMEITSNYAPAVVREISIKNHKYILRKPVVEINEENVEVLQFLDCLKDINKCADENLSVCGEILSDYAKEHEITRQKVDRVIENYPLKVYKAIYDTGVQYVST